MKIKKIRNFEYIEVNIFEFISLKIRGWFK